MMISDRKTETLKERLKKKHGDLKREVSPLLLKGLGLFSLNEVIERINPRQEAARSRELRAAPRCGFIQPLDTKSACFSAVLIG